MHGDNPKPTNDGEGLERHIRLLKEADAGNLDNLECPNCRQPSVSVWFTNPVEDTYRTWLLCTKCSFHSHAINAVRPPFFSEKRRRADLKKQDRSILKNMIFKASQS
jgi:hypothetical protein